MQDTKDIDLSSITIEDNVEMYVTFNTYITNTNSYILPLPPSLNITGCLDTSKLSDSAPCDTIQWLSEYQILLHFYMKIII